ncbi:MAG: agmatine deiminase family protein [Paludibacter sp.]|jgi:agmatine/peptidylarginine deiminase|nr:agmatine deiminase family protein [Paludibacter sp.]
MLRFPAEWEPQRFIQLTWPHAGTDWAPMIDEVNQCFVNLALAILRFEPLLVVCADADEVRQLLREGAGDALSNRIHFAELPTNDTWARDHGGITVFADNQRMIYDYAFNGWGQKFEASLDNELTRKLVETGALGQWNENRFEVEHPAGQAHSSNDNTSIVYRDCLDFVLEGGSLESDGNGTLLTTSECLLSKFRNPSYTKEMIEHRLKEELGLSRILWLNHGYLEGDDTDSHIDTLARFCDRDTIAYVRCDDPVDAHFEALRLMEEELKSFKTFSGQPYRLIPLPMADAAYDAEGNRLPATYANFLIVNGAVLMPTYGNPFKDEMAINQLKLAFPDREIVGVDCRTLIEQHGSLHCVTMQY